ncbi:MULTISPECIES: hypothetical protein [Pseudomonas syringae group]|uniref:Uncharacterized protein n=2 Tax=Pseudomonas syringae group TaxID=136849 RepID=A0A0P9L257_PSECA|nr:MULTISPECIES: hypothetical protein [Pseudomonas syringae group]KPW68083.1 hypothetical protein ALO81_200063 [Pseudomonas cannabina]RMN18850.1 hypothetical protein ALQ64_00005 [Pseudomonas cannabina]RMV35788.1 hypothetical protein ALP13_200159 [Pseudomonas syringae pv. maculicola]SDR54292.1 hypothetical protein SAMN05216597_5665 [Pseudomonas cannabina]
MNNRNEKSSDFLHYFKSRKEYAAARMANLPAKTGHSIIAFQMFGYARCSTDKQDLAV